MLEYLKDWTGRVSVNDVEFDSIQDACNFDFKTVSDKICIVLHSNCKKQSVSNLDSNTQYIVTVKQYMTKKSTPEFDFMEKWNKDIPMPLRTMVGTKEKETRGMVYMKLHGDTTGEVMMHCMKCGKPITNPVSQFFGMGPECGGHNYTNPFDTEADLKEAVDNYRKNYLQKITWEGWIIKSAIVEEKLYEKL